MTITCVADHCGIRSQHRPDCADPTCYGCLPRPAADGVNLCHVCTVRIAEDARTAAVLHEDMTLTLIRPQNRSQGITAGRSAVGGPVPDDEVMEARSAIRATLVGLCRLIAEERGITLPADDVPAMAGYIGRHAVWLAAHPAADEHARDLRDIASDRRTWRLAYPSGSDRLYIGECPLAVDGGVCGTRLHQHADQMLIACPRCGAEETIEWWQQRIVGDVQALVDAYAAAADLAMRWHRPVDPALVRKWASLGKVARHGKDRRGRTLYDVDELRQHAERLWGAVLDDHKRTVHTRVS